MPKTLNQIIADLDTQLSGRGKRLDASSSVSIFTLLRDLILSLPTIIANYFATVKDLWIDTDGFKAPGAKPATLINYGLGSAWEFTDGTDDTITGRIKLPDQMNKSELITIFIGWSTPTANAGNCIWQVEYLFRSENEAMDATADGTLTQTVAASSVAKGLVLSEIGEVNASVDDICIIIRVKRRADLAGDTLGEDNQLFGTCFKYTAKYE